jgi:hypothetical protein
LVEERSLQLPSAFFRKKKNHLPEGGRYQKAIVGICFAKKSRAETPQHGLKNGNFKSFPKSSIFNCISWLTGSVFGGNEWGFLKKKKGVNPEDRFADVHDFFRLLEGCFGQ